MLLFCIWLAVSVLSSNVFAQNTTRYCDSLTSICYSSYTSPLNVTYRIALPNVSQAPFDTILQIVAPISTGWTALAWGGTMVWNTLSAGWANGTGAVVSSRFAYGLNLPGAYSGAEYSYLKGTGTNSTHWTLTARCRGCSLWQGNDGTNTTINPAGNASFAWAYAKNAPTNCADNSSTFNVHDNFGKWTHDLSLGRSSLFNSWVASNLLVPDATSTTSISTPTSTIGSTSRVTTPITPTTSPKTTSTSKTTTLVTSTTSSIPAATSLPVPATCSGVPVPKYSSIVASGWKAIKVKGGLTTPRGVILDSQGNVLIVESGKGITVHTPAANGCISTSKTLISQTNLNHGIYLSNDGKTLYASSMTSVWSWTYDPVAISVSGSSKVIVNGMNNGGHPSRTLIISPKYPNLLVVSEGSNENIDVAAGNMATERAVVKVFDMSAVPSGGYNFVSGGYQMGWGLRNEVGLAFDPNNMLWGVENSSDDAKRVVNGQSTDIHIDNPAEELNYLGDISTPNKKWYGYPTCFTVWSPSVITDRTFKIGDQLIYAPNSTYNDATCAAQSTGPRLAMQAHSAPLDSKFDSAGTSLYVSFHGSWDRTPATGYKLVVIPFEKKTDGSWGPVADVSSGSGYTDIWWNTDVTQCSATQCFRPVGIVIDKGGRLYVSSDASGEGELWLLGKG